MPYFVEYVAVQAIGRSRIQGVSPSDALTIVQGALRGVPCTSVILRYAAGSNPGFGEGSILATYTPTQGWMIHGS
ncbi:hypothetical protein [Pseudarthrobacter sp. IC2-21]|jgi:hypothetical protein|uniref:hypothetical protein n=1 Tax=Pseudarthrobacter sp. IC2-21 TaxID=3092262 RepID=UPI002A69BCFA|nr:hypothetical protein [Pseudarthrobacter sp. IC2-21]